MKAVQVQGDSSSPKVVTTDSLPEPKQPQGSEILVQVHAAGITGDELQWPELYSRPSRIPGHEISGIITALGPEYRGPLVISQEVFAFTSAETGQGQAEYVLCHANEVVPKPTSISHQEAAALPIPLLTAWEGIMDHGRGIRKPGMRILITGASGAVGRMAVQIAALNGAYVIALASARYRDVLRELGAHEVVDYNKTSEGEEGWETRVRDVSLVIDTVGGDILTKSWETVDETDGTIVTVGDPPPAWAFGRCQAAESTRWPNVKYIYFIISPNTERLGKAAEMIDAGALKPLAVKSFPFRDAEEAWSCARQRGRWYKVVIDFVAGEMSK